MTPTTAAQPAPPSRALAALVLAATCLALFAFVLAATLFWAPAFFFASDELTGIGESFSFSYSHLLLHGPSGELNTAPLHYLLDKTLLQLVLPSPQLAWNLRVLFRLLPATWLALTAPCVFLCLRALARELGLRGAGASACAAALALFPASNHFLLCYALEDRPYSLWVLFSVMHACLFALALRGRGSDRAPMAYVALALAMALTSYVASVQLAIAAAAYLACQRPLDRRWVRALLAGGAAAGLVSLWFYLQSGNTGPIQESQAPAAWSGVRNVLLAALRPYLFTVTSRQVHHVWETAAAWEQAWVFVPLLAPLACWQNRCVRAFAVLVYGLLGFAVALGPVMSWHGHLLAGPKYLIFLFPYLFGLLALLPWIVARGVACLLPALRRGAWPWVLPAVLATVVVGLVVGRTYGDIELQLRSRPDYAREFAVLAAPKPGCPARFDERRTEKDGIELSWFEPRCR